MSLLILFSLCILVLHSQVNGTTHEVNSIIIQPVFADNAIENVNEHVNDHVTEQHVSPPLTRKRRYDT